MRTDCNRTWTQSTATLILSLESEKYVKPPVKCLGALVLHVDATKERRMDTCQSSDATTEDINTKVNQGPTMTESGGTGETRVEWKGLLEITMNAGGKGRESGTGRGTIAAERGTMTVVPRVDQLRPGLEIRGRVKEVLILLALLFNLLIKQSRTSNRLDFWLLRPTL